MEPTAVRRPAGRPRKTPGDTGSSTRDRILDAAETVVSTLGAQALTLDAVYRQAGISKGGLLYHFPSKEALIDGMIARYLRQSEALYKTLSARGGPDGAGDLARRAAVAQLAMESPGHDRVATALLAAVANDLERLKPLVPYIKEQFRSMDDSPAGFENAAIVELATIGLTFLDLLRLDPLEAAERDQILRALDRLAGGDGRLLSEL